MKKLLPVFFSLICVTVISCRHHDDNLQMTFNDEDHHYSMKADFGRHKTREVEYYLKRSLGTANNISFSNTHTDATFTLDDRTTFYLRKGPGHVEIKLDKDENSRAGYHRIKSMCEGMKSLLTK